MLILTVRTDKPEAELGLYDDRLQLAYSLWPAHRELAETIQTKIAEILTAQQRQLSEIAGLVVFKGPGSFTGLRIGLTVANALAYSLKAPIVAAEEPDWIKVGITRLLNGDDEKITIPEYGALPNITAPKK